VGGQELEDICACRLWSCDGKATDLPANRCEGFQNQVNGLKLRHGNYSDGNDEGERFRALGPFPSNGEVLQSATGTEVQVGPQT
jgi:hypothetical protein